MIQCGEKSDELYFFASQITITFSLSNSNNNSSMRKLRSTYLLPLLKFCILYHIYSHMSTVFCIFMSDFSLSERDGVKQSVLHKRTARLTLTPVTSAESLDSEICG